MIVEPRVFDDEHLPRRLQHREREEGVLLEAWEPALSGEQPEDVLLHGPSGVGKTVLSRHALRRLADETPVQTARVRCLGRTTTGVLRGVLADLPGTTPAENTPLADVALSLQERVDDPTIVVLDEADDLPTTDALGRLADVRGLGVVVIAHDPDDWLARCDQRIRQRIGVRVGVDRFGVSELADILEARARQGLRPETVTRAQLEDLADRVAGVARNGIQALFQAAHQAEQQGRDRVTDQDIADGPELARHQILQSNLQSLPFHHRLLYQLIHDLGPIKAGDLHDHYDDLKSELYRGRSQTPISRRARRTKLQKLVDYGLIQGEGVKRHREYYVTDDRVGPAIDPHGSCAPF